MANGPAKRERNSNPETHLPFALRHLPLLYPFVAVAAPFASKEFQMAKFELQNPFAICSLPFAFALLDLISRNAQPTAQGKLQSGHFATIGFVIVAPQVQEAM
jgi:hypothetical protein